MSEKLRTKLVVKRNVTIEQIRAARPSHIFYGANTCWWTHNPDDLQTTPSGLPVDPRGGVLFQADDPEKFLTNAENNPQHYGKHGLAAFLAAHHANSFDSTGQRHWCSSMWSDYNDGIDDQLQQVKHHQDNKPVVGR